MIREQAAQQAGVLLLAGLAFLLAQSIRFPQWVPVLLWGQGS